MLLTLLLYLAAIILLVVGYRHPFSNPWRIIIPILGWICGTLATLILLLDLTDTAFDTTLL